MSVAVQARPIISGSDAEQRAIDSCCVKAFCLDPRHKLGPWFADQYVDGSDNAVEVSDHAATEIVRKMKDAGMAAYADRICHLGGARGHGNQMNP